MYSTILLDPPWPERGGGKIKRGADRHYQVISSRIAMIRVIMTSPAWKPNPDAHVYMWSTDNYLSWAMWIMECLGVKMHRTLPWTKPGRMGLGQYFRGCHELLLFGTIGRGKSVCKPGTFRTDALCGAPSFGRHSAKPERAHVLIESRSMGPYMEMFARNTRVGWSSWGNEV